MGLTPSIRTGMPAGSKPRPRSDFRPEDFDQSILTKGYRMFWSRGAICPCRNNDQTEQPDPTCALCGGDAYFYFLPDPALPSATEDADGNPIVLNKAGDAVQIHVLMTQLTQDVQIFEKFGEWVFGLARASTMAQNRLGYRDRLVAVDSEMVWAQLIEADGTNAIAITGDRKGGKAISAGLRYGFLSIHLLRSKATVFREDTNFALSKTGSILWITPPPAKGTLLTIHGTVHPQWIVMDHVHTLRDTFVEGTDGSVEAQKFRNLPVQAVVKLDFLVND